MILRAALACCLALSAQLSAEADEADFAATAIEISGEALFEGDDGKLEMIELGQLFSSDDRVMTRNQSSLQLLLANGSTLSLGPNAEMTLTTVNESKSLFELIKGSVNAIIEKLAPGSEFEIKSPHALAAVKGTQFELSADTAESIVTVHEGSVSVSDSERMKTVAVGRLERLMAGKGRLNRPFKLSKRDAGDFELRWKRARMIHGQRNELKGHFEKQGKERREALKKRLESSRERRQELKKDRDKKSELKGRREMQERRKEARERFEKAREEIKKERKKQR